MGVQYDFQDTDAKVLKSTLKLNWTEPYKVLVVGPCSSAYTPDCSPLGAKLLYLDLPSDMPGANARRGVPVQRCKPCTNPHDNGDMRSYSPARLTRYALNNFSPEIPPAPRHSRERFDSSSKTRSGEDHRTPIGSRSTWGHCGDVRNDWTGLSGPSWEREKDLQLFRHEILRYGAGTPNQHHQTSRLYRRM